MEQTDWMQMMAFQQELHHLSRAMLAQSKQCTLTASELELLSLVYLQPEEMTPLVLSRRSGMKKEAVSRCLRQLNGKGCIRKEKHPQDERSYILFLTEQGREMLNENYEQILRPIYALRRAMGQDFNDLFRLICSANETENGGF